MKTRSGTSSSAAISSAGQKTAWNLRMSLPIRWTVAGQKRSVRSSPGARVGERRVVVEERVDPDVDDLAVGPTAPALPS